MKPTETGYTAGYRKLTNVESPIANPHPELEEEGSLLTASKF